LGYVLCGADRVMVGGKWVVTDGATPGLDTPDLIRRRARDACGVIGELIMARLVPAIHVFLEAML
jgi:hypothetical protein